jgi:hypothetical protein
LEEEVNHLPIRIYGSAEFRVPSPEERKTLLLTPSDAAPVPFKTVSGEPTGKPGAESITSQPWFVPALVLASAALVTVFLRRS